MKNEINAVLENMTTATPEPEDYTGEDGLLYCGRCRKPKEAYPKPAKPRHRVTPRRHIGGLPPCPFCFFIAFMICTS